MSLKQYYSSEAEIPTELKSYYAERNGKYELQVDGFESVTAVFSKNTELIERQKKDADKITELEAKATEVNTLTRSLADKNTEISRLSNDLTKAQGAQLPSGYVAVQKKEAEIIDKMKAQNLELGKVAETLSEFEAVRTENNNFKLEKSIAEFAEAEKVQNVKALTKLIKQDGVIPLIKEVDENGQKVKKGFLVKQNGEETDEKPYKDYKESNWAEFSHSLDQTAQPPRIGSTLDPTPFGAPTDTEAAKIAQNGQRAATHSAF
jgi:hypothetical protein